MINQSINLSYISLCKCNLFKANEEALPLLFAHGLSLDEVDAKNENWCSVLQVLKHFQII